MGPLIQQVCLVTCLIFFPCSSAPADQLLQTVNQPTDIDVKHLNEVDVTLDVDTAHPNLLIDGKTVSWIKETPQRLCSEKMFDEDPYVLGIMGRAWRAYWKVNVEKKEDWVLGVTKATSNRKGQLVLSPANGFWVIRLSNGGTLKAMDDKEHVLDKDIPDKIGIYLDYKEKKVTFYNVEDSSLIYSFTNGPSYQDDVRPLFSPWNNDADPITILSIV
nr:zinc-binding protein A33-like isoform X2 [Oncorhynchus nerka]